MSDPYPASVRTELAAFVKEQVGTSVSSNNARLRIGYRRRYRGETPQESANRFIGVEANVSPLGAKSSDEMRKEFRDKFGDINAAEAGLKCGAFYNAEWQTGEELPGFVKGITDSSPEARLVHERAASHAKEEQDGEDKDDDRPESDDSMWHDILSAPSPGATHTLLQVSATWCGPCVQFTAKLQESGIVGKRSDLDWVILSINDEPGAYSEHAKEHTDIHRIDWGGPQGWDCEAMKALCVIGVPSLFLIENETRKVLSFGVGSGDAIRDLLKAPAPFPSISEHLKSTSGKASGLTIDEGYVMDDKMAFLPADTLEESEARVKELLSPYHSEISYQVECWTEIVIDPEVQGGSLGEPIPGRCTGEIRIFGTLSESKTDAFRNGDLVSRIRSAAAPLSAVFYLQEFKVARSVTLSELTCCECKTSLGKAGVGSFVCPLCIGSDKPSAWCAEHRESALSHIHPVLYYPPSPADTDSASSPLELRLGPGNIRLNKTDEELTAITVDPNYTHRSCYCDGCEGPVEGTRWKCACCRDFDYCKTCNFSPEKRTSAQHSHDPTHPFLVLDSRGLEAWDPTRPERLEL